MTDEIKTRPSRLYEEEADRIFGKDRKPQRGRWVWDEGQQKLVPADEYQPPARALDAPVMVDRFYEGTKATDGTDIGSRRKHREYMKEHGLAPASDYSDAWYRARRESMKREADKNRRETVARVVHTKLKP